MSLKQKIKNLKWNNLVNQLQDILSNMVNSQGGSSEVIIEEYIPGTVYNTAHFNTKYPNSTTGQVVQINSEGIIVHFKRVFDTWYRELLEKI